MNRRRFLQIASAAAAALVVDPEQLLWTPGAKTIFLPPEPRVVSIADGLVAEIPSGHGTWARVHVTVTPDQIAANVAAVRAMGGRVLRETYRPHTVTGWR